MTIALIAIMAGIAFPAIISQMAHIRLTRTTRDIAVAMQAARLKAIARNVKFKVFIQQGAPDNYRLMYCDTAVGACANATLGAGGGWTNDPSEYGGGKDVPGGINITAPAASSQTIFFPAGTATNEADTTADQAICIQNTGNMADAMVVGIRGATGRVSVTSGC
ncbi:MAG: hypothetical protein HZB85_05540 [Deltaproteobacteria bacterium]|nr:hypothetical protein [Deltaproteobacteria bacterium]